MSHMSELATLKDELLSCSTVLKSIAENLQELARNLVASTPPPTEPPLTLADVRKVLAQKSVEGHNVKVHELIHKYGAEKLSAVDAKYYASMLAEAEVW